MSLRLKQRLNLSRFIKGEKPAANSITLSHRRIFILPTLRGLGFVLLIALLLLIALVYNNNLAYLLGFLLASIFFITILHSFKALANLKLTQGQCQSVFAGEAVGFDIAVENPNKVKRSSLQISLEHSYNFYLAGQESRALTLYSATRKRGWHTIETITLSSAYPLGLFRAWSPVRFSVKALVYPKPSTSALPFPIAEGNQTESLNIINSNVNDDYYGMREYYHGDPIRHIHWKALAKGYGLFSKQFSGNDALDRCWLNYDQTPGHSVEERLSQLCRWVIDADQAGIQYGFNIPGLQLEPNQGKSHYLKCLEALALFKV